MTLPILDSMLRGELRRNILADIKTEKEISLLWKELLQLSSNTQEHLRVLENALIQAVERSGLVLLSTIYDRDRQDRESARRIREIGFLSNNSNYTDVIDIINLEGIFDTISETTPTDKFLHLLLKLEFKRTIEAMREVVKSVQDDAVVGTYIRNLFSTLTSFCKDTKDLFIQESITQFYFELYHTFKKILDKGEQQSFETDFENFVYEWKGEFPDTNIVSRYNKKINELNPTNTTINTEHIQQTTQDTSNKKDKIDLFLEEADKLGFSDMEKVKMLGSRQKVRRLVECLLQQKGTSADTFGHTAAMLDFLEFYNWIRNNVITNYNYSQYDDWCTKHILNKQKGHAFSHYRLSVNATSKKDTYRYNGWKYKEDVKTEYKQILEA